ncbi:unnamed protein product [Effrenium voratum]|nr:unnamed protein product [Effrenium voratum]
MGRRVRGTALVLGGGLCFVPGFTPLSSSSSSKLSGRAARLQDGLRPSSMQGSSLAFAGTAAMMAAGVARVARSAEPSEAKPKPEESTTPKDDATSTEAAKPSEAEEAEATPAGFDLTKQVGATAPLGFWDPAKLCKGDEATFRKYRIAELKHGRVAMMAALGGVVQHFITFPGFNDVPRGIEAPTSTLGGVGFLLLIGLSGYLETGAFEQDPNKEPGDFGDPLGIADKFGKYDDEWRNREINNGRFAMFAALGIIVAENETGYDAVEQIFGL